jgi:thymidylate synthase (FAD)
MLRAFFLAAERGAAMNIIGPSFEILDVIDAQSVLKKLEEIGRVCYKSEARMTDTSAGQFISMILKSGHESVIEHEKLSVRLICDRGVSHEIVRHRIASYSQESTRYCNYADDRFGSELTFIKPCFWEEEDEKYLLWTQAMTAAEDAYNRLVALGAKPEEARSVLPCSVKTELIMTMNYRAWRHFFKLRTSKRAHPQMREIACALLEKFKEVLPVLFDDID